MLQLYMKMMCLHQFYDFKGANANTLIRARASVPSLQCEGEWAVEHNSRKGIQWERPEAVLSALTLHTI